MPVDHRRAITLLPDVSALVGGVVWLALFVAPVLGGNAPRLVVAAVALAALVVVPLVLATLSVPPGAPERVPFVAAVIVQLPAGLLAVFALGWAHGVSAIVAALPWVAVTAALAGVGLLRLRRRGLHSLLETSLHETSQQENTLHETCLDAGLIYVVVGSAALVAHLAGVTLAFDPAIVLMTIPHFHYAGFALPVVVGLAGRIATATDAARLAPLQRVVTGAVLVGPGLVATGITASAFGVPGARVVEFLAVALLTTAVVGFAVVLVVDVARHVRLAPKLLLVVAATAVSVSMVVATVYGFTRMAGGSYFGIHATAYTSMVRFHGSLNAVGFALPAVLALRLVASHERRT